MAADMPLAPGRTIGILGGGQLGRMLALAAARLGFNVHIYTAEADAPAEAVAATTTRASYDDNAALDRFAASVDVVTTEFENVPAATLQRLSTRVAVSPPPRALAIAQDRVAEKDFAAGLGLATAGYGAVGGRAELDAALARIGCPAILKTRRLGYDGKGQVKIDSPKDAESAFAALHGADAILEARVPFVQELSVILARGRDGTMASYDPPWNIHTGGILTRSIVPAGLPAQLAEDAVAIARRLAHALDYVGVLAVELFRVETKPALLVNEIAPRVHNSGHWTLDACVTSQFEQHIRAIAGWPLGSAARGWDVIMDNIIGEDVRAWADLAREPNTALHIYGKDEARPGRKMGHLTRLYPLGARPGGLSPSGSG